MPTKNPRLSVVLTPSLGALLSQMSEVTGESASSIVRDLLVQAEGPLRRALQLMVAASSAKGQIGQGVAKSMDRVVRDLESMAGQADDRAADLLDDLVTAAEAVRPRRRAPNPMRAPAHARAGGAAKRASTPVPVTRGSGTPKGGRRGRS